MFDTKKKIYHKYEILRTRTVIEFLIVFGICVKMSNDKRSNTFMNQHESRWLS